MINRKKNHMIDLNAILITILNVNDINMPTDMQRLAHWIWNQYHWHVHFLNIKMCTLEAKMENDISCKHSS